LMLRLLAVITMDHQRLTLQRGGVREADAQYVSAVAHLQAARNALVARGGEALCKIDSAIDATESDRKILLALLPSTKVLPATGRKPTRVSLAFRSIASFIPDSYAKSRTETHRRIIEALVLALGIPCKRDTYHHVFGSLGLRRSGTRGR
jgi:hypothetical protein